ncbi:permease [Shewanella acanthi]|uniref:permease n=1 Tax=Shewanella acanthi TaxID=2864212 RepID=UPI001C6612A7|nr:permease [Shewanella acanthi]QYJ79189.1 permease [Shewanella acanthi]
MLLKNFIDLFLDSAPWLLLGLILAGLLKVFVPMAWMQKQLGGHGFKTVVKAALLGAPLPLCSCGVIPAAVGLRRSGASKAATTSFLVSTPETGVDSVTVSYVLLGPFMAIVRPIAAVTSAIVAGLLVGRDDDDGKPAIASDAAKTTAATSSCCAPKANDAVMANKALNANKAASANEAIGTDTTSSCCSSTKAAPSVKPVSSCCSSSENKAKVKVEDKVEAKPAFKMMPMQSSSLMAANAPAGTVAIGSIKAISPTVSNAAQVEKVKPSASCCSSEAKADQEAAPIVVVKKGSCCGSEPATKLAQSVSDQAEGASCCASTKDTATELKSESVLTRIGVGLKYAATDLVRDTTLWLLVGLFFAALVQTYVPADFLAKWGDGIGAMLVMVLISIPMYICATASTPIAAGLLLAGVSPGAVLVFMMAGPATNIATLGVVSNELGKRALFGYLSGVLGVALVAGMVVNYLVDSFGFVVMPQIGHEHQMLPSWLVATSGIVLAALMARVLWQKIPRSWVRRSDCCS